MKRTIQLVVLILLVSVVFLHIQSSSLKAQSPLFIDDFETDLSQWVGKSGGTHNGLIVIDPLNPLNKVLTFTNTNASGDVFSIELPVDSMYYILKFDYLGYPPSGLDDGNGGTIGTSDATPGVWIDFMGGTVQDNLIEQLLIDDGAWHTYTITFNPFINYTVTDNTIRVTIEDWSGSPHYSGGIPGDAFFDNISVYIASTSAEESSWGRLKNLFRK